MYTLVKYSPVLHDRWDEFAAKYGSIFHTIALKKLLEENFGYTDLYHCLMDKSGDIRAILPMVSGKNILQAKVAVSLPFINYLDFCHDGSIRPADIFPYLEQLQIQNAAKYLQVRLKDYSQPVDGWQQNTENSTFLLPLSGSEQDVLALSSGSNRNHTRKVYKNNYFDVSFDQANLAEFYKVYQKRMHELGSPAPTLEFFQSFFRYFPDQAQLLTVLDRLKGSVVGGMLLIASSTDKTLYYPYGANLVEYNSKYLNNFMYFEAIKLGQRLGMEYLDLGRSPLDSGTYRFKKQWGATAHPLNYLSYFGKNTATVPDKDNMAVFINIWQRLPRPLVNYLGARLIKNVLP